jgi:Bacterial Ig-like domain (group 1)
MRVPHYHQEPGATILVHPTLLPGQFRSGVTTSWRKRMPHTTSRIVRRAWLVVFSGVLGCGSDLVLPDTPAGEQSIALTTWKGDGQSGPVGEVLPDLLVVKVLTASQQPVAGVEVSFALSDATAGTLSPPSATTNSEGQAFTQWQFGTAPGSYTATAKLVRAEGDTSIAEFHASAVPAAPDTLSPNTPLAQPGQRNQPVRTPPQVRVVDRFGNPVPNIVVSWDVLTGEGEVPSATTATDSLGLASTEWDLGNERGVHKLTATVDGVPGSPLTFTAYVLF